MRGREKMKWQLEKDLWSQEKVESGMCLRDFPGGSSGKEPACQCRRHGSLGEKDPLEEGMATHSSILAWRIPWTEEPSGLQSMGSPRVRRS